MMIPKIKPNILPHSYIQNAKNTRLFLKQPVAQDVFVRNNNVSFMGFYYGASYYPVDLSKEVVLKPFEQKFEWNGEATLETCTYKDIKNAKSKYYQNIASMLTKDTDDYKFFQSCKGLTLESDVDLFPVLNNEPFLTPIKFAIMADNSIRQKGNAYIVDEVPEIFKGLDIDEVMNKLSNFARIQCKNMTKYFEFEIGGKKIKADYVNSGARGKVFKLEDEYKNSVVMKTFCGFGKCVQRNSVMTEIPLSRQLKKDGVGDVPRFYMANAAMYQLREDGKIYDNAPWMITQFIEEKTPLNNNQKSFKEWLEKRNMFYCDDNKPNHIGKYTVDVGGIQEKNQVAWGLWGNRFIYGYLYDLSNCSIAELVEKSLRCGMSLDDILEIFK